ncbi:MAG: ABC transporter permease [Bacilli bacterium]
MNQYKIIISIFLIGCILPIFIIILFAVSDKWIFPNIIPESFTLKHLRYVVDSNSIRIIGTSIILGIMTGIFSLFIGIPTAKALVHYDFKHKNLVMLFILLPLIVPPFTIISVAHTNIIKVGLDGTLLGVCLIHSFFSIPYVVRILIDYFSIAGSRYEESAKCLGANRFQTIKYITLPIIKQGLLVSFFLSFTISISQYITTLIIGGGKVVTLSTLLIPYIQYGDYEIASVYSLIIIFVSMIGYLIAVNTQKILDGIIWS